MAEMAITAWGLLPFVAEQAHDRSYYRDARLTGEMAAVLAKAASLAPNDAKLRESLRAAVVALDDVDWGSLLEGQRDPTGKKVWDHTRTNVRHVLDGLQRAQDIFGDDKELVEKITQHREEIDRLVADDHFNPPEKDDPQESGSPTVVSEHPQTNSS